jgi:hypothetical protein
LYDFTEKGGESMDVYEEFVKRVRLVRELVEKFEAAPKSVMIFLQEEEVPAEFRDDLRERLNTICVKRRLGDFLYLVSRGDEEWYFAYLIDEFERAPKEIADFLGSHHVPVNRRADLERLLKTVLLLSGSGRALRRHLAKATGKP